MSRGRGMWGILGEVVERTRLFAALTHGHVTFGYRRTTYYRSPTGVPEEDCESLDWFVGLEYDLYARYGVQKYLVLPWYETD
jgi:hypothetical protein